jgi:hypothetical protein
VSDVDQGSRDNGHFILDHNCKLILTLVHDHIVICMLGIGIGIGIKGRFTLWLSKSRGSGIEWPNFVESPKKWAENS